MEASGAGPALETRGLTRTFGEIRHESQVQRIMERAGEVRALVVFTLVHEPLTRVINALGREHGIQIAKPDRQQTRGALPDVANPQTEDQPVQRAALRVRDLLQQVRCGLLGHPLERGDLVLVERVEIG